MAISLTSLVSRALSYLKLNKKNPEASNVPLDEEVANAIIGGYSSNGGLILNPDTLVQRKGLDVYDEMLTDDQVYAISYTKKLAILAPGWQVLPASQSKRDIAISDFVKWNLVNMPGTFRNVLFNVLTAMDFGYSLSEKVWTLVKNKPKYNGLIAYKNIKAKDPRNFDFLLDQFGNILGVYQISGPTKERGKTNIIDPGRFIHYAYNTRFSNPYGRSDLRAAYLPWIEKKMIRRFWNIFLERFGAPPVVAEIPRNATPKQVIKIKQVMRNIQAQTGITIPENFRMFLLEAERSGSGNYDTAIHSKNMAITHAILMPDLLGFSGGDHVGTFALGKAHIDIFFLILQKVVRDVEDDVVGEQIIKPLVDFNFKVSQYPRFKFDPIKAESRSVRAKVITLLLDSGLINGTETWIRDFIEIPKSGEVFPQQEQEIDDPALGKIFDMLKTVIARENANTGVNNEALTIQQVDKPTDSGLSIGPRPDEQSPGTGV